MPEAIQNLLYSLSNADGLGAQIGGWILVILIIMCALSIIFPLRSQAEPDAEAWGDIPALPGPSTRASTEAGCDGHSSVPPLSLWERNNP